MKLQLHNFTILQFSLNDEHVTLYVWHEIEDGVTSNDWLHALLVIRTEIKPTYALTSIAYSKEYISLIYSLPIGYKQDAKQPP